MIRTYRNQKGEWVLAGPANELVSGKLVTVVFEKKPPQQITCGGIIWTDGDRAIAHRWSRAVGAASRHKRMYARMKATKGDTSLIDAVMAVSVPSAKQSTPCRSCDAANAAVSGYCTTCEHAIRAHGATPETALECECDGQCGRYERPLPKASA